MLSILTMWDGESVSNVLQTIFQKAGGIIRVRSLDSIGHLTRREHLVFATKGPWKQKSKKHLTLWTGRGLAGKVSNGSVWGTGKKSPEAEYNFQTDKCSVVSCSPGSTAPEANLPPPHPTGRPFLIDLQVNKRQEEKQPEQTDGCDNRCSKTFNMQYVHGDCTS